MRAVLALNVACFVDGDERLEKLCVGDAVYVRTVVEAEQLERVIVTGIHVPDRVGEEVMVDVMWFWTMDSVHADITAEAVRNGANAARDVLIPISRSHFGQRVSIRCVEFTRWCPYFPSEAPHLSLISAGRESARVAGFLQHVLIDGAYMEKYHPPQALGPRANIPDVYSWVVAKAPGLVRQTTAADVCALQAAGYAIAGGVPHIDLRPLPASIGLLRHPVPPGNATGAAGGAGSAGAARAEDIPPVAKVYVSDRLVPTVGAAEAYVPPRTTRTSKSPGGSAPAPAAHNGRKRRRSPLVEAAVEDRDDECNVAIDLTPEEVQGPGALGDIGRRLAEQDDVCPIKAWDAALAVVKDLPPRHFHWEIAKLVAPSAYEIAGFGTNTWAVREGRKFLEVDERCYHRALHHELLAQIARVYSKDEVRILCTIQCPAVFAANLLCEFGQLHAVGTKRSPTYNAGVQVAPKEEKTVEARMNAFHLGLLLRFPPHEAITFDGRIHLSRRQEGAAPLSSYRRLRPLTVKRLADRTEPVASLTYSHTRAVLTLKMSLERSACRTQRSRTGQCMDLDRVMLK